MPMRSRLGAIIYVGIKGTQRLEAEITRVQAYYTSETPGAKQPNRLEVVIGVLNRSNSHIVPEGSVVIRDEKGKAIETVPIQSGWGLLPNEEDKYRAIGHGVNLREGKYTLEVTVLFGKDILSPSSVIKTIQAIVNKEGILQLQDSKR